MVKTTTEIASILFIANLRFESWKGTAKKHYTFFVISQFPSPLRPLQIYRSTLHARCGNFSETRANDLLAFSQRRTVDNIVVEE
jgi:hypothetical protein